jgi:hypothetical protein
MPPRLTLSPVELSEGTTIRQAVREWSLAEVHLGFPRNLAHAPRCGRDLRLLFQADARRISRAREAARKHLISKRQQISSLMLRQGRHYPGKKTSGGQPT